MEWIWPTRHVEHAEDSSFHDVHLGANPVGGDGAIGVGRTRRPGIGGQSHPEHASEQELDLHQRKTMKQGVHRENLLCRELPVREYSPFP